MHKVLSQILESKKKRMDILNKNREGILSLAGKASAPLILKKRSSIMEALICAEIKQASPSTGILRKDFDPVAIAKEYEACAVDAISIVTEEEFFMGKLNYIEEVKKAVDLPVLRKDFILEEIQVYESRAAGADAVLLIMGILTAEKFKALYELCRSLGMHALVEVHTEKELRKALSIGVEIVGINNRNLQTLEVDLETTQRLVSFLPQDVVKVSESGVDSLKDMLWLKGLQVDAVLVGSSLMRAANITEKIKELRLNRK